MIEKIIKFVRNHTIDLGLAFGSVVLTALFHWVGIFDFLELKTYDYRFHTVRGPLTGWRASDSTIINKGTDVVLVEVDDESWRILKDNKVPWPYPRGDIWARVIDNISKAGASVIAFDIQFDSPDARSEYLRSVSGNLPPEFQQYLPGHGDIILAESIKRAQENGTDIVMDVKMVREPTRIPPTYIAYPVPEIMEMNPETGLINDMLDTDGFSRQYSIAGYMEHEPDKAYLTLGLKCVKAFLDIPDNEVPKFNSDDLEWTFGDLKIKSYGRTNNFLVNYYGPPSGYKIPGGEQFKPWGTFPRFSLSQVIDTDDYDLPEDIDWMSQFIPGQLPDWIMDIEDQNERDEMMKMMGIGSDFDIKKSPFYNKIVIIGVSVEVLHDVKSTPFYNYMGLSQLTPGMETHANAMQTVLHENFISTFGGKTTRYLAENASYPFVNILLIFSLCAFAYLLLTALELHPIVSGLYIFIEGLVYYAFVMGAFTNDYLWFLKSSISSLLPDSLYETFYDQLRVNLPMPGESVVFPIIAPISGLIMVFSSNIVYQFLHEQQDKKFLRETFGTYIAPKVLDKMYEEKQAPKLGGVEGHHTAFFSDIQNFSTFSEVLEPERMVSLMNEYLTVMSKVILDNQGTLDKYIGDAIVAFYGAPAPVKDHEIKSCYTALAMQKALDELRVKWKKENNWPDIVYSMQHRIGLNCGRMVTGNMGSEMRMNYTMMGDTVNLAARLESSAKQYGIYIQVANESYTACKDQFVWRDLDFVRVMGKTEPAQVYELIAIAGEETDKEKTFLKAYHEALALYRNQEWDKAKAAFQAADELEDMFPGRKTNPSRVYIPRCDHWKENPPGDDWDGVWTLTSK